MNISLNSIQKIFVTLLHRYHVTLFVIVAFGGLSVVMFQLNSIIQSSATPPTVDPASTRFDQATIDKVKQLRASDQPAAPLDLSGRSNPFVE